MGNTMSVNTGKGMQPKCCNYGGNHSVAYGGCEVMEREVEIQQVKVQKTTYAKAVKMVNQRRGRDTGSTNERHFNKQQEQPKESKV